MYTGGDLNVLIVDDELLARSLIKEFIGNLVGEFSIYEAANAMEAETILTQNPMDLIFLDIEMPKKSGIDFLVECTPDAHVIFTTAYNEFAVKAFELNAIDYLLKPFSENRFKQAIDKAFLKQETNLQTLLEPLQELLSGQNKTFTERFLIKDRKKMVLLKTDDIQSIESNADYVEIYTADGKSYTDTNNMQHYESVLNPSQFIRIHRSCIINLEFLKEIEIIGAQHMEVEMLSGKIYAVSKSGQKRLKTIN